MKSLIVLYLFYTLLFMSFIFAQNITETEPIDSLFDDSTDEDVFLNQTDYRDYGNSSQINETDSDLIAEEAVPSRTDTKNFDNTVHRFLDSGLNFLQETRNIYKEELNDTDSDSEAKNVWIAYSMSLDRVLKSLVRDFMPKFLNSEAADIDISLDCITALMDVINGLQQQKDWAVKLFDSSGRPFSSGTLDGTVTSFGHYDQCLSIEREPSLYDSDSLEFIGQYCIVKYGLALPKKPKPLTLRSQIFNFTDTPVSGTFLEQYSRSAHAFYDRSGRTGVCIPSLCSNSDFQKVMKRLFTESHLNLTVNDCHTKVLPKLNSLQITILWIMFSVFFLMVLSTSLDLVIAYTKEFDRQFIKVESPIKKLLLGTLLSFSVYRNGRILFNTKKEFTSSSIECVNGIRVLSMIWILWTHTYLIPIKESFSFAREFMFTVEELGFQLVLNGWVLVDSFFLVGAMVTSYTNFNRMIRNEGQINILQQIVNRLFRFLPSVTLTVSLVFVVPSLTSGPLWKEYFDLQLAKCYDNWWTTLLFINNWYDESQMCLLHTWYLAADIQLFIIGIIFIIPLYKKPSFGVKLITLTAMASALAIAVRTFLLKQNPTVLYNTPIESDVYNQASTIYVHTYIHLGPYFVGLLLGYAVFKYRNIKINPFMNLLIWLISLFGCLSIMLSTYSLNRGVIWRPLSGALYAGLHRTVWAICVSWIIFGCSTGNGGPINTFLSWKLFAPLGKLSFMTYLMHFLVIWVRYAYNRQPLPFSHYTMFCEFIVNLVISICVAIVTHLAIEAPFLSLYRIYLSNLFKFANIQLTQTQNKKVQQQVDNGIIVTSKL